MVKAEQPAPQQSWGPSDKARISVAFENTRTALSIASGPIRSAFKGALHNHGFHSIMDVTNMVALHDLLADNAVDLIVTTSKLGHDDITMLLREMRHNRLGINPFVATIVILESADKDELGRVVNAGVDDVLLMPVSPGQLISRIETIKQARKPFIFAHEYIGPNRRKEERPGTAPPVTFDPPNPLKLRDTPLMDDSRYNSLIANGLAIYHRLSLAVQSRQMEYQCVQIAMGCRSAAVEAKDIAARVTHFNFVAKDLKNKLPDDEHMDHRALIDTMINVTAQLAEDPKAAKMESLQKMVDAAKELKRLLSPLPEGTQVPAAQAWS
jgi:DNA-binding response OmpR family regulator